MDAKQMMRLCESTLKQLDDLESVGSYIPEKHNVFTFIYAAMRDVRELRHIAKFETEHNVTTAQATHINGILSRIAHFNRMVPKSARKGPDG